MAVTEERAFVVDGNSVTVMMGVQSEAVQRHMRILIDAIITHNGFQWVDGHGGAGGFWPGLETKLTEMFQQNVFRLRCDEADDVRFEVQSDGSMSGTHITATCASRTLHSQEQAVAVQARQELVLENILDYLTRELSMHETNIAFYERQVSDTEAKLVVHRKKLRDYLLAEG